MNAYVNATQMRPFEYETDDDDFDDTSVVFWSSARKKKREQRKRTSREITGSRYRTGNGRSFIRRIVPPGVSDQSGAGSELTDEVSIDGITMSNWKSEFDALAGTRSSTGNSGANQAADSSAQPVFVTYGDGTATCTPPEGSQPAFIGRDPSHRPQVCRLTLEVGDEKKYQLDSCVDSGATFCMLSMNTYTKMQTSKDVTDHWMSPLRSTKVCLHGASGQSLNVMGEVSLYFRIDNLVYVAEVLVGNVTGVDMLLGLDWLIRARAVIDFGTMTINLHPRHSVKIRTGPMVQTNTYAVTTPESEPVEERFDGFPAGAIHGYVITQNDTVVPAGTSVMVRCMISGRWEERRDALFTPSQELYGDHVRALESLVAPEATQIGELHTHLIDVAFVNQGLVHFTVGKGSIVGRAEPLVTDPVAKKTGKKAYNGTRVYHLRNGCGWRAGKACWAEESLPAGQAFPEVAPFESVSAAGFRKGQKLPDDIDLTAVINENGDLIVQPVSGVSRENLTVTDTVAMDIDISEDTHPSVDRTCGVSTGSEESDVVEEKAPGVKDRVGSTGDGEELTFSGEDLQSVSVSQWPLLHTGQSVEGEDTPMQLTCPITDSLDLLMGKPTGSEIFPQDKAEALVSRSSLQEPGTSQAGPSGPQSEPTDSVARRGIRAETTPFRGLAATHEVLPQPLGPEMWPEVEPHLRCMLPDRCALAAQEAQSIIDLLGAFGDVFVGPDGRVGWTEETRHCIQLENCKKPFKGRPRARSQHDKKFIEEEIASLLKQGKIRPSKSPWGAPVVLVRKKDGKLRFCIDFRELNDVTKKDAYPIPRIDELLDCLNGSQYFCTLDLASGYWQIAMHPDDIEKTAFTTHAGLYEWIVMPFGLCNAPATFCRLMETVLSDIVWNRCLVYLDDIIAFGKTFQETLDNLRAVFVRLQAHQLRLKASKCELFKRRVDYLGHEVSNTGIRPSPRKMISLHNIVMPKTVTQIKSFIGVCSYYRRFIANFSEIAAPLNDLTKKGATVDTSSEACQQAFEQLKKALLNAPTLHFIDPKLPFVLDTDASDNAIGACLAQNVVNVDGESYERPIAFASKTLVDSRRRYCTTKKELYAVVYYMNYWKSILSGGELVIRTDHYSLLWLLSFGKRDGTTPGMYFRWAAQITVHSMVRSLRIIHRPGAQHQNADGMSRMVKKTDSCLRIPEGGKMNGCKYPKCVDCQKEREYNQEARGSDSEDSDEESDFEVESGVEFEPNDLPVHMIVSMRMRCLLQQTGEEVMVCADIPIVAAIQDEAESIMTVTFDAPVRRSARVAARKKANRMRRSERIAKKAKIKEIMPPLPSVGEPVARGKPLGPRRRPPGPQNPNLVTKNASKKTPSPKTETSLLLAEIKRLTDKVKRLEGSAPPATELKPLHEGEDAETQVDALELECIGVDEDGVPLIDTKLWSDETEQDYKFIEKEIERVPEICPDFTDSEWVQAQIDDPILSRVREIVQETIWVCGTDTLPCGDRELREVKQYIQLMPELELAPNGILCWREPVSLAEAATGVRFRRLVPSVYRIALFHRVHRSELQHFGYDKVFWTLRKRFWWTNMSQDVLEWCQACESCQNAKPGPGGSRNPLKQSEVTFNPMERLAIDLVIFTTETRRGNKVMLAVQDYSSKWIELFALPNKTAVAVEQVLNDEIFLRYGACLRLHSDQGVEFDNELLKLQLNRWGIDKTRTSGYAPWSNGQVERSNRSVKGMLRQIGEANPETWDLHLPKIRAALNNAVQHTTGQTPHKVFFSQCCDARMPIDLMACEQPLEDDKFTCATQYIVRKERIMCEILAAVRKHMGTKLRLQAVNVWRGSFRIRLYVIGDYVLRKCAPADRDTFQRYRWRGPSRVLGVDNTGHNVLLRVPATGRPDRNGKLRMTERWIHTSNVKPCRFDSQGRLLLIHEFRIAHPGNNESLAGIACEYVEADGLNEVSADSPTGAAGRRAKFQATGGDSKQQGTLRVIDDDGVWEEYSLTAAQIEELGSMSYFEHYYELVEMSEVCLETHMDASPSVEMWNSILKPGEQGPSLTSEMMTAYLGDGSAHVLADDLVDTGEGGQVA